MQRSVVPASALLLALGLAGLPGAARADDMKSDPSMQKPKAGAEMKAIAPIFGVSSAHWTGKLEAGAMGPDSKESESHGKVMCHSLLGGLWYACDVQDTYGTGKGAMEWNGHMMVGYDVTASAYRASVVDDMGTLTVFNGVLAGSKFSLETPTEVPMMGQLMKDRLSWDMSNPNAIVFTDEHQVGGGDWKLVETATMQGVVTIKKGTGIHVSN